MSLNRLYLTLLALLIFLAPSNLFYKFAENLGYVHGLLVDYLIPKFYLSDIVILLIIGLWLFQLLKSGRPKIKLSNKSSVVLGLFVILALAQFFTKYPASSVWYLLKVVEMSTLFFAIRGLNQSIDRTKLLNAVWLALAATLVFQSLLGVYQFITQRSFASYTLLGEVDLSFQLGLAKTTLFWTQKVLPYGTTAHPNVLAGVLALYALAVLAIGLKLNRKLPSLFVAGLAVLALIFTVSVSAWITFVVGILAFGAYYLNIHQQLIERSKVILMLWLCLLFLAPVLVNLTAQALPNYTTFTRRAMLNTAAVEMIRQNSMLGVGLNNFTGRVEEFGNSTEIVRFVQPVHHAGLLWLGETAFLGVALLFAIIRASKKPDNKYWLLIPFILLPVMALDHYLLTLQTGMLLLLGSLIALWGNFS